MPSARPQPPRSNRHLHLPTCGTSPCPTARHPLLSVPWPPAGNRQPFGKHTAESVSRRHPPREACRRPTGSPSPPSANSRCCPPSPAPSEAFRPPAAATSAADRGHFPVGTTAVPTPYRLRSPHRRAISEAVPQQLPTERPYRRWSSPLQVRAYPSPAARTSRFSHPVPPVQAAPILTFSPFGTDSPSAPVACLFPYALSFSVKHIIIHLSPLPYRLYKIL